MHPTTTIVVPASASSEIFAVSQSGVQAPVLIIKQITATKQYKLESWCNSLDSRLINTKSDTERKRETVLPDCFRKSN
jgi:hypothetical protein